VISPRRASGGEQTFHRPQDGHPCWFESAPHRGRQAVGALVVLRGIGADECAATSAGPAPKIESIQSVGAVAMPARASPARARTDPHYCGRQRQVGSRGSRPSETGRVATAHLVALRSTSGPIAVGC
jgi:hypothetical protein